MIRLGFVLALLCLCLPFTVFGWEGKVTSTQVDANPVNIRDFKQSEGNSFPGSKKMEGSKRMEKNVIYYGDIVSHIYHAPGCPEYQCESCIADFKGRRKAERAGYKPCPVCNIIIQPSSP